jgi:hypothetical protein
MTEEFERERERFRRFLFSRFRHLPYKLPVQALEASLNRHIWDKEFLALLCPLHRHAGGAVFLSQYLEAWPRRRDLARLNRESPNFMPLLNLIPRVLWPRPDLLRDDVLRSSAPAFLGLSAGALRWLRKAPAETLGILYWCFTRKPDSMSKLIEVLAELRPPDPLPPELQWVVFPKILYLVDSLEDLWAGQAVLVKRLARLLARHLGNLWAAGQCRQADLRALRAAAPGLGEFLDWYRAEGRPAGLPDKNSTWLSLGRRADRWHEEIWQRETEAQENVAWESLLGETLIDGISVKPLVSELDLYIEGRQMRHCVSSYSQMCLKGGRRVFALLESDGRRSTLSLAPHKGGFAIDQHKGPDNGPVSAAAARAAREICRLYTQEHQKPPTREHFNQEYLAEQEEAAPF